MTAGDAGPLPGMRRRAGEGGGMRRELFTCLVHRLFKVAVVASIVVLLLSMFAWVEAVRLPDYANYWEWREGWHVGVRSAGTLDRPDWWDTYAFVGQFPDQGVLPTPPTDVLVSPYRFPDLRTREVRLLWPVMLSLAAPLVWFVLRFRRKPNSRGFPAGRYPPAPPSHFPPYLSHPRRRQTECPPVPRADEDSGAVGGGAHAR